MKRTYTAYLEFDPDTGFYVGTVPGIPEAYGQGAILDELDRNLAEVLELVLEARAERGEAAEPDRFAGIHQVVAEV